MNNPFMPKTMGMPNLRPANSGNVVEELKIFAQNLKVNPRQEVQRLLNSGQMSQQQYDFLVGEVQRRFPYLNK